MQVNWYLGREAQLMWRGGRQGEVPLVCLAHWKEFPNNSLPRVGLFLEDCSVFCTIPAVRYHPTTRAWQRTLHLPSSSPPSVTQPSDTYHPSQPPSIPLSIHPSIRPSIIHLNVHPFIHPFILSFVHLSSISMSIHLLIDFISNALYISERNLKVLHSKGRLKAGII